MGDLSAAAIKRIHSIASGATDIDDEELSLSEVAELVNTGLITLHHSNISIDVYPPISTYANLTAAGITYLAQEEYGRLLDASTTEGA